MPKRMIQAAKFYDIIGNKYREVGCGKYKKRGASLESK
jgi:hypothetical protein